MWTYLLSTPNANVELFATQAPFDPHDQTPFQEEGPGPGPPW